MPTYKNISNNTQIVHNINFKPLEEKEVEFYIYDETNFKKISDDPVYSPIAFSKILSSGESLKIKENLDKIIDANQIRLAAKEPALISFNGDDNKILVTEHPEFIKPLYFIDEIKCEEGEVSVEFWRPARWRN